VFLKASLALTFNRILLERWQRVTVQVTVAINTIFGLTFFFLTIFRCGNPMDFYSRYNHSMCVGWEAMQGLQYTNSIINTLADWILALLPIFALRAMKMNHQAKVSAVFIFVLGCVSSIMSMPRFGFIFALGGTGSQFWTMAYPVAVLHRSLLARDRGYADIGRTKSFCIEKLLQYQTRVEWKQQKKQTKHSQRSN
jgi:vacuolar-type H+-ATPase subunit I/STV1